MNYGMLTRFNLPIYLAFLHAIVFSAVISVSLTQIQRNMTENIEEIRVNFVLDDPESVKTLGEMTLNYYNSVDDGYSKMLSAFRYIGAVLAIFLLLQAVSFIVLAYRNRHLLGTSASEINSISLPIGLLIFYSAMACIVLYYRDQVTEYPLEIFVAMISLQIVALVMCLRGYRIPGALLLTFWLLSFVYSIYSGEKLYVKLMAATFVIIYADITFSLFQRHAKALRQA